MVWLADNLHFAASIHGITGQDNQDIVDFTISRLGLEQYKKASWNEISGGFKMRFVLAKAIICNPKLIILDEPLANLDINTQALLLKDLIDFAQSKKNPISIIISSQNIYEVENIADNIIFIKNGQAKYNGLVKNLGENRNNNSYEINCNLSKKEITDFLKEVNLNYERVEQAGNNFIIHTYKNVTNNDLLRVFIENNISLKYFRDISQSTRKLFEKQL
ncbi:MAG: ATP-binding cassette domain-containing protein [Nostoc sp.]|uniref:ATP-binding cassette domain-containing protein n=1 Tax=Nostoc sp. TaxID=1180 RepID=UPI002FF6A224